MKDIQLNTSYKAHAILGIIIGIWLVLFQILISPFDVADLTLKNKLILIPPYGILLFISYMAGIGLQNWLFKKSGEWSYGKEALILSFVFTTLLFMCFAYYKTLLINGTYSFLGFTFSIYLPTLIIFVAFIILGRMYLNKLQAKKNRSKIILKGINKGDILQIEPDTIVCISSAQNYIEVYYLQQEVLQKKLLRNTLKNASDFAPHLIQVHRSHLVHPEYFVKWINSNTALFHSVEIAVSKKYKDVLEQSIHS